MSIVNYNDNICTICPQAHYVMRTVLSIYIIDPFLILFKKIGGVVFSCT